MPKKYIHLYVFLFVIVFFVASLSVYSVILSFEISNLDNDNDKHSTITVEQYERVEDGMTYNEVIELFQNEGELLSEAGQRGTDNYCLQQRWDLEDGGSVVIFFEDSDMIVTAKIRHGR